MSYSARKWEFALSSGRLLKKIAGPGKGYLCLMGCQWALASQNHSSPSEKIQPNSGPPIPEHGMKMIRFPATLCPVASANPVHVTLVLGVLVRWGEEEQKAWAADLGLLQELTLVYSREEHVRIPVPFVQDCAWMIDRMLWHTCMGCGSRRPGERNNCFNYLAVKDI